MMNPPSSSRSSSALPSSSSQHHSSPHHPSPSTVPSKRRSKASPSDVIFGQPPGSDEAVQSLGPLSSDSSPSSSSRPSSRPGSSRKRPHPRGSSQSGTLTPAVVASLTSSPKGRDSENEASLPRAAVGDVIDGVKVLPLSLDDADPSDILTLVGDMLLRLMQHNDSLPLHPSSLTRFHSRATPGISIQSYLRRIAKYTSLDKACTLILLVYIDRVCERMKGFTICSLTVHRFVCAAVVCATKALCDAFSTNGHYARVGGISLVELNMLEKEFLGIIDWHLTCSGGLLQHYYVSLVGSHPNYRLETELGAEAGGEGGSISNSSGESEASEAEEDAADAGYDAEGIAAIASAAANGEVVKPSAGALAEEPYLARKHRHHHHHHHHSQRGSGASTPALEAERRAQQRGIPSAGGEAEMEE